MRACALQFLLGNKSISDLRLSVCKSNSLPSHGVDSSSLTSITISLPPNGEFIEMVNRRIHIHANSIAAKEWTSINPHNHQIIFIDSHGFDGGE